MFLVLAAIIIGLASFGYVYYNDSSKTSRAIQLLDYNYSRAGSGFNVTFDLLNAGRHNLTLGTVFVDVDNSTRYDWVEIVQCQPLELSPHESTTITFMLSDDILSITGMSPYVRVETLDRTFCEKQIDLLG